MSHPNEILFRPFRYKGLELRNRIVMAPMTRAMAPEGIPAQANAAYYARRAEGEVGLILSEGTVIDRPASRNLPGIPFFHGAALDGWKTVIDAVHAEGGKKPAANRAACVHCLQMFPPEEAAKILDDCKRVGVSIGW